jgi:hypothetical protein
MISDYEVLEAALICLHRNSDRCVVPDANHTVYSVNKNKSIPKIRLRIPSSNALLDVERHKKGDPDLKKWDTLADAGNLVTWLTYSKKHTFSIMLNGALIRKLPCLSDVPVLQDVHEVPEKMEDITVTMSIAEALHIHASLHADATTVEVKSKCYPIGKLADDKRVATPCGIEYRADGDSTILVVHGLKKYGKKCYRYTASDYESLRTCPLIGDTALPTDFDPMPTKKPKKSNIHEGKCMAGVTLHDLASDSERMMLIRGTPVLATWCDEQYVGYLARINIYAKQAQIYWDVEDFTSSDIPLSDIKKKMILPRTEIIPVANLTTKNMHKLLAEWSSTTCMAPNLSDYNASRAAAGLQPLEFEIVAVSRLANPFLEERYNETKSKLIGRRDTRALPIPDFLKHQREELWGFHGTAAEHMKSVLDVGLRPRNHPTTGPPISGSGDDGYFGRAESGVYIGRCINYVAKYSNGNKPLQTGDTVQVLALKFIPGKEKYLAAFTGPIHRTPDYDSHLSPAAAEWWLPVPYQSLPRFLLTVKALERAQQTTCDDM